MDMKQTVRNTLIDVTARGMLILVMVFSLVACSDGAGGTYSSSGSAPGSGTNPSPTPNPDPTPSPSPTPTPSPTLSFSAAAATVATNGSTVLTWSTSNATACSASGAWSGSRSTAGSQNVGPLTTTGSYTLNCTGAGGSITRTVTVTVVATVAYTLETAWAPNTDNPDGYNVYIGGTSTTATNLAQTLVKGSPSWNPAAPLAQIPSSTVLAAVGSGSQVCVQIRAYNAGGVSGASLATCAALP